MAHRYFSQTIREHMFYSNNLDIIDHDIGSNAKQDHLTKTRSLIRESKLDITVITT